VTAVFSLPLYRQNGLYRIGHFFIDPVGFVTRVRESASIYVRWVPGRWSSSRNCRLFEGIQAERENYFKAVPQ
jgi:hypothetical protein